MRLAVLLSAALLVLSPLAASPATPQPAGWKLVMSWSPAYCERNRGSTELQCTQANYFVPRTLEPVAAPGTGCAATQSLGEDLLSRLAMTTLNRHEVRVQWAMQGGCVPAPLDEYAVRLDYVHRKLQIPADYEQLEKRLRTSGAEIREKFMQANPDIKEDGIELRCDGGELSEVAFCLDGQFNFSECPSVPSPSCKDKILLRGARAGRFRS